MQRRSKREQNHSSAITVWCSASGKGGTSKTTLFCFSFVEEEESTTSLLEALLTLVEVGGRAWARCAWAQVEQTAERVRSSSLQSTPLCGQYTLLDRRLSISFFSAFACFSTVWLPPKAAKCDWAWEEILRGSPLSLGLTGCTLRPDRPDSFQELRHSRPKNIPGPAPPSWPHSLGPYYDEGPILDKNSVRHHLCCCKSLHWKPIN